MMKMDLESWGAWLRFSPGPKSSWGWEENHKHKKVKNLNQTSVILPPFYLLIRQIRSRVFSCLGERCSRKLPAATPTGGHAIGLRAGLSQKTIKRHRCLCNTRCIGDVRKNKNIEVAFTGLVVRTEGQKCRVIAAYKSLRGVSHAVKDTQPLIVGFQR